MVSSQVLILVGISFLLGLVYFTFLLLALQKFDGLAYSHFFVSICFLDKFFLCFGVQVHQHQGVFYEVELYSIIEGSVSCKTGGMVDFNNHWVELVVDHDIDSQNMKTHIFVLVIGLGQLVLVAHEGLSEDYRLD